MKIIKPKRLGPGSTVSVVAPSGPVSMENFEKGIKALEAAGFRAKYGAGVTASEGYLAGSDERRLGEFDAAFRDPGTDAVWCARGGYGSMRLLSRVDWRMIASSCKPLAGFSDVTALELALFRSTGMVSFHAPLLTTLWNEPPQSIGWIKQLLAGDEDARKITAGKNGGSVKGGQCTGRLLGGNLSIICSLMGTPFLPDLTGAILLVEDVNEEPYRIDRMLTQLDLGGVLGRLAGIVAGRLTVDEAAADGINRILLEKTRRYGYPVATGFPFGHGGANMTFPQGINARFDADSLQVELLESCVD